MKKKSGQEKFSLNRRVSINNYLYVIMSNAADFKKPNLAFIKRTTCTGLKIS